MNSTLAPEPSSPEQAQLMARLRRMMMIAGVTTSVAIAVLLVAIGYRLFRGDGDQKHCDRDRGGHARDHHHAPQPRHQLGLLGRGRLGR
ncbi:MAG: hypothetical protein ACK5AT_21290, partial [Bradyrhizobium sp.]